MRILYLIETGGRGGAETILHTLANHFRGNGDSVALASCERGWLTQSMQEEGFDVSFLPPGKEIAGFDFKLLHSVCKLIRDYKPDIIHAFLFHMNFYGAIGAKLNKTPCIVSLRSKHYDFEKRRRVLTWKLIDKLATQITTASNDLADVLSLRCNIDRKRIRAIPNGVDTEFFMPPSDKDAVKHSLGLSPDKKLVGTIGRMHPIKGHEDCIEALGKLKRNGVDFEGIIIGAYVEDVLEKLRKRVAELGIEAQVTFPGHKDDSQKWLQALDYFVLPSHSEGMSNSLLEAMATGLPIVATDVGSNMELLDEGRCGFMVPAHNPDEIADKLRILIESDQLSKEYASAARERVMNHYSRAAMFQAYTELYREVALGGKSV